MVVLLLVLLIIVLWRFKQRQGTFSIVFDIAMEYLIVFCNLQLIMCFQGTVLAIIQRVKVLL